MALRLITPPSTTPISLQEARDHLYLSDDAHNDELVRKVEEATDYCQRRIRGGRQFCAATYELLLDEFPNAGDGRIELPRPPLTAVGFIRYRDSAGSLLYFGSSRGSTASSSAYSMVAPTESPGYVVPAYGQVWPETQASPAAVTVRFTAGSTDPQTIPAGIKAALKLKLENLWDPERLPDEKANPAVDALLDGHDYGFYG